VDERDLLAVLVRFLVAVVELLEQARQHEHAGVDTAQVAKLRDEA
jgi:hypothetical protein